MVRLGSAWDTTLRSASNAAAHAFGPFLRFDGSLYRAIAFPEPAIRRKCEIKQLIGARGADNPDT